MNELNISVASKIFKALGDPNRLNILKMLQIEEKCACQLLAGLEIGQSTLSHHMKILADANLVNCKKVGKWIHYSLNQEGWSRAKNIIIKLDKGLSED